MGITGPEPAFSEPLMYPIINVTFLGLLVSAIFDRRILTQPCSIFEYKESMRFTDEIALFYRYSTVKYFIPIRWFLFFFFFTPRNHEIRSGTCFRTCFHRLVLFVNVRERSAALGLESCHVTVPRRQHPHDIKNTYRTEETLIRS